MLLKNKKIISLGMILVILIGTCLSSFAVAKDVSNSATSQLKKVPYGNYQVTLNKDAINFLKTFVNSGVTNAISLNENGKVTINMTDSELKSKYNLTDSFIQKLKLAQNDLSTRNNIPSTTTVQNNSNVIKPNLSVSNWKIYFTQSDVATYLAVAASAGTGPMMLALDALMTALGGPVGTVLGVVLSIIGTGSIINLCYLTGAAVAQNKGLYIGIDWSNVVPFFTEGLW